MKKRSALLLMAAAAAAVFVFVRSGLTVTDTIRYAHGLRGVWWTPFAYFAAYAVLDVLFIPTQLLSVAAAVIWGWMLGGTIEVLAATSGAMLPYVIARSLRTMEVEQDDFSLMLVLRLVPIIPYTALNYAAGLTRIRPSRYALATLLGILPSTYIFAFFVDSMAAGVMQPRQVFARVAAAGLLLGLLVIVTRLAASRLKAAENQA